MNGSNLKNYLPLGYEAHGCSQGEPDLPGRNLLLSHGCSHSQRSSKVALAVRERNFWLKQYLFSSRSSWTCRILSASYQCDSPGRVPSAILTTIANVEDFAIVGIRTTTVAG